MTNPTDRGLEIARHAAKVIDLVDTRAEYVIAVRLPDGAIAFASSPGCRILDEIRAKSETTITMSGVLGEIVHERERQISKGYDAAHDDQHVDRELVADPMWGADFRLHVAHWSQSDTDYREKLIEAAAMLIAEIERVDRANAKQEG